MTLDKIIRWWYVQYNNRTTFVNLPRHKLDTDLSLEYDIGAMKYILSTVPICDIAEILRDKNIQPNLLDVYFSHEQILIDFLKDFGMEYRFPEVRNEVAKDLAIKIKNLTIAELFPVDEADIAAKEFETSCLKLIGQLRKGKHNSLVSL